MNRSNTFNVLLIASNITFTILFVITSYRNRLSRDDFHFLDNLNDYGIWDGMIVEYQTWSSRYASVLLNHSVLWLEQQTGWGLFIFGLLSLFLMTAAIRQLRIRVFDFTGRLALATPPRNWNTALFLASILYYLTPDKGETWHWLCAACTYLWSAIATIYIGSWLLHRHPKLIDHVIGVLACIYLGGSLGPLALLVLGLMAIWVIAVRYSTSSAPSFKRVCVGWLILAGAFYLLYRAEGNVHREAFFESITIIESLWLNIKMCGILILRPLRADSLIVASFLIAILVISKAHATDLKRLASSWILPTVLLGVGIFAYQWPVTYKTQDIVAIRALLPVSMMIIIYMLAIYQRSKFALQASERGTLESMTALSTFIAGLYCMGQMILA